MNKYKFTLTETNSISYIVEGTDPAEAYSMFHEWVKNNHEEIYEDLRYNTSTWDISKAEQVNDDAFADILYEELKDDANEVSCNN